MSPRRAPAGSRAAASSPGQTAMVDTRSPSAPADVIRLWPRLLPPPAEPAAEHPPETHPFARCVNPHLAELLGRVWLDKRFVRGEGSELIGEDGRRYLDCVAAYGALP